MVSYPTRRFPRLPTIVLAVLTLVLGATSAAATHFDNMFKTSTTWWNCFDNSQNNPYFCQTDNQTFTWWAGSGQFSPGAMSNFHDVMEGTIENTDLSVSFENPPVTSGLSETDVIFLEGPLPGTAIGVTWCNDAVGTLRCDQHYVRLDGPGPGKKVICHETGHALGLTHGEQAHPAQPQHAAALGCLRSPLPAITNALLGNHNTQQINATY